MENFYADNTIRKLMSHNSLIEYIKKEANINISKIHGFFYAEKCPFCGAKLPAFRINEKEGNYVCYACGRGGNIFDFLMRYKNFTFTQSVDYLSHTLKKEDRPTQIEDKKVYNPKVIKLHEINRVAALFYFEQLRNNVGKQGMEYFDKRGVSPKIRSEFALGYAGEFGDTLYKHLLKSGFSQIDVLSSGLISKSQKTDSRFQYYDKFWNRVMFPILNADNKIIAFGGRLLGDGKPKYLNSPETPAFQKHDNLYCYNLAKNSKRNYFICCEGYMDAMSLHQYGFDCAVASLGTALTREQIKLLSVKKEIYLAYDSDEAGIRAAKRAIELCREVGLIIKVIRMVGAKDPDEYLKKFGADAFEELIQNAESDKHFLIRNSKTENGKFDFDSAVEELL